MDIPDSVSSSTATPPAAIPAPASQAVKRGRRSNPKVKTGCNNCKQRRIKCDEKRPACTQCTRSHKTCSGYPAPSRAARIATDIRIAPKPLMAIASTLASTGYSGMPHSQTVLPPRRINRRRRPNAPSLQVGSLAFISSPTIYQPPSGLGLPHSDALYFELFRRQTAVELSGYFNSNFWTQRILQECHSEVAIRHAVVALGALYKTLEQSCESPGADETLGSVARMNSVMYHWQVAIKQYSEACNAIALLTGENLSSHRTRLMASILLACFDSFIGDHKQAIIQIQTGLGLLERIQAHQPQQQQVSSADGHLEEDLLVIFTRLAIQAKSYDMAFHFPQPYVIRLAPQNQPRVASPTSSETGSPSSTVPLSIPHRFVSLAEARVASDQLCKTLLLFIERLQLAKTVPGNVLPASWKQYGMSFKGQLDLWSEAFEPIFQSRMAPDISHLERAGIAALKMFQINTNVLFLMMFCDTEVQFDTFMPHFKGIVDLGCEVVGEDEKRAAAARCPNPGACHHTHGMSKGALRAGHYSTHHIRPSFSADLGIVPPLFVVATKCRDRKLRRQAIQLLRSSARRECMWDSELAANIGSWVMHIEESGDAVVAQTGAINGTQLRREDLSLNVANLSTVPIPEEKRVMVKSVDFDLRARFAELRVGTRALHDASGDQRSQKTRITW